MTRGRAILGIGTGEREGNEPYSMDWAKQVVAVSDAEVDNYLATIAAQSGEDEYQLSHVYVTVPEQATPDRRYAAQPRGDGACEINSGKDFAEVAASYSDAPDASSGGNLGWRTPRAAAFGFRRRRAHDEAGPGFGSHAQRRRVSHREARRQRATATSRRSSTRLTRGTS